MKGKERKCHQTLPRHQTHLLLRTCAKTFKIVFHIMPPIIMNGYGKYWKGPGPKTAKQASAASSITHSVKIKATRNPSNPANTFTCTMYQNSYSMIFLRRK